MAEPRIIFADTPIQAPAPSVAAVDLTVIAREIRESFTLGYDKAIQFYQTMTQPQVVQQPGLVNTNRLGDEDEEYAPGVLDLRTVSEMSPVGRAAFLAAHGLQALAPAPGETDRTAETMNDAIRGDGLEPPSDEPESEE